LKVTVPVGVAGVAVATVPEAVAKIEAV